MRRTAWAALGLALLGFALLSAGNAAGSTSLQAPGALLVVAGAAVGVGLLPFWRKALPPLPELPDLFRRPRGRERWCAGCGRPAPARGTCASCGEAPRGTRRRARRLHRKQGAAVQERKT